MQNRRRVVYYAILLLLILGDLLGELNYIIIIFPEYDTAKVWSDASISTITGKLGSQYVKIGTVKNTVLRESKATL